jgi:hypothetical protein
MANTTLLTCGIKHQAPTINASTYCNGPIDSTAGGTYNDDLIQRAVVRNKAIGQHLGMAMIQIVANVMVS